MLLIIVPGPSVLFVIGRALTYGRATALASVAGNTAGTYPAPTESKRSSSSSTFHRPPGRLQGASSRQTTYPTTDDDRRRTGAGHPFALHPIILPGLIAPHSPSPEHSRDAQLRAVSQAERCAATSLATRPSGVRVPLESP